MNLRINPNDRKAFSGLKIRIKKDEMKRRHKGKAKVRKNITK